MPKLVVNKPRETGGLAVLLARVSAGFLHRVVVFGKALGINRRLLRPPFTAFAQQCLGFTAIFSLFGRLSPALINITTNLNK